MPPVSVRAGEVGAVMLENYATAAFPRDDSELREWSAVDAAAAVAAAPDAVARERLRARPAPRRHFLRGGGEEDRRPAPGGALSRTRTSSSA